MRTDTHPTPTHLTPLPNQPHTRAAHQLTFVCCFDVTTKTGGLVKDDAKEFVGAATKVKVAKNKLAPPFRECTFDMMFGKGICKRGELLDLGEKAGLLAKQGAWYAFTEDGVAALGTVVPDADDAGKGGPRPFAQGREKAKAYLEANADVEEELERQIRDTLLPRADTEADAEEEQELKEEEADQLELDVDAGK